ncbi:MAG: hypothetical protein OXH09_15085, partial [Gammaproteobacteria bacterium]|nr:hypothetical protein [Gammaproteobacteria bacterium]
RGDSKPRLDARGEGRDDSRRRRRRPRKDAPRQASSERSEDAARPPRRQRGAQAGKGSGGKSGQSPEKPEKKGRRADQPGSDAGTGRTRERGPTKSNNAPAGPSKRKPRRDRASISSSARRDGPATARRPTDGAALDRAPALDAAQAVETDDSADKAAPQTTDVSTGEEARPQGVASAGRASNDPRERKRRVPPTPVENDNAEQPPPTAGDKPEPVADPVPPATEGSDEPTTTPIADAEPLAATPSGIASLGRASNDPRLARQHAEKSLSEETD